MLFKKYTGMTQDTAKKLVLDAGAFCKNYDLEKSFEQNKQEGRVICATQSGGGFSATPTFRQIKVDGMPTHWKDGEDLTDYVATLNMKMVEHDAQLAKMALGAAKVERKTLGEKQYDSVSPTGEVTAGDYIDNVCWIGRERGKADPMIIVIRNGMCLNGISWTTADGTELLTDCTVTAHWDPDAAEPFFEILYPVADVDGGGA